MNAAAAAWYSARSNSPPGLKAGSAGSGREGIWKSSTPSSWSSASAIAASTDSSSSWSVADGSLARALTASCTESTKSSRSDRLVSMIGSDWSTSVPVRSSNTPSEASIPVRIVENSASGSLGSTLNDSRLSLNDPSVVMSGVPDVRSGHEKVTVPPASGVLPTDADAFRVVDGTDRLSVPAIEKPDAVTVRVSPAVVTPTVDSESKISLIVIRPSVPPPDRSTASIGSVACAERGASSGTLPPAFWSARFTSSRPIWPVRSTLAVTGALKLNSDPDSGCRNTRSVIGWAAGSDNASDRSSPTVRWTLYVGLIVMLAPPPICSDVMPALASSSAALKSADGDSWKKLASVMSIVNVTVWSVGWYSSPRSSAPPVNAWPSSSMMPLIVASPLASRSLGWPGQPSSTVPSPSLSRLSPHWAPSSGAIWRSIGFSASDSPLSVNSLVILSLQSPSSARFWSRNGRSGLPSTVCSERRLTATWAIAASTSWGVMLVKSPRPPRLTVGVSSPFVRSVSFSEIVPLTPARPFRVDDSVRFINALDGPNETSNRSDAAELVSSNSVIRPLASGSRQARSTTTDEDTVPVAVTSTTPRRVAMLAPLSAIDRGEPSRRRVATADGDRQLPTVELEVQLSGAVVRRRSSMRGSRRACHPRG